MAHGAARASGPQNHDPDGETDSIPDALRDRLDDVDRASALCAEDIAQLCVRQLVAIKSACDAHIARLEVELAGLEQQRGDKLNLIGNIVDDSVPVSADEKDNLVVRVEGLVTEQKRYSHVDLIHMIDGVDLERGAAVAGSRGYYLKGPAVCLEMALLQHGMQMAVSRGYTPLYTPFFMRKEVMAEVAQLQQFDLELYKVTGKASENPEDSGTDERYLIATSEQPIAALHRDEWIAPERLPLKYIGVSSCFRQEVGSHGRDTRGIFRVHQFEKLEQFVVCSPYDNTSWAMMDEMIGNAEDFCKSLGIGYRIVSIVSKELNNAAAKKLDLEAWFPGSRAFRELVSCSNCTDYQARSLRARYGECKKLDRPAEYVHMLNSTLCAISRNICVILESYQTDSGVVVPDVLRPHMPPKWRNFIPFVRPPLLEAEQKAAEKQARKATKAGSAGTKDAAGRMAQLSL